MSRRRRSRAGTVAVAALAVVGLGVAVAAAIGFGGSDSGTVSAGTLPPTTAKVTRQTLVDTETHDGELGYGATRTVTGKLGGTLTWLPTTGATVKRGEALFRVDDTPVVLLYGPLPAYRTLSPGVVGKDVTQFEQNLQALGYSGFTVDDEYTWATAEAVTTWQERLGLDETGRIEPGRIVYADGEVRVAAQSATAGDTVQAGKAMLSWTGTARVVTVKLDVDDQRLAASGAAVAIRMPDGKRGTGKITKVETVIETTAANNGQTSTETKVEVTVTVDDPAALTGYDRASVDVDFTASRRENVLTVPVAALLALAEGGYGLQLVEGSSTRIIAVQTGLFANGRVEVSGTGLAEGSVVGMPK